jgi:hypothetical protein
MFADVIWAHHLDSGFSAWESCSFTLWRINSQSVVGAWSIVTLRHEAKILTFSLQYLVKKMNKKKYTWSRLHELNFPAHK